MGCTQEDLDGLRSPELAALALAALRVLARRPPDGHTFPDLLEVLELGGLCAGEAARALAGTESWSHVGERAGTSRQAAWARWHE